MTRGAVRGRGGGMSGGRSRLIERFPHATHHVSDIPGVFYRRPFLPRLLDRRRQAVQYEAPDDEVEQGAQVVAVVGHRVRHHPGEEVQHDAHDAEYVDHVDGPILVVATKMNEI